MSSKIQMIPEIEEKYTKFIEIGKGSFGKVYKATHRQLNKLVAIKKVKYQGNIEKKRLKREVETLAAYHHPNIIKLEECYTAEKSSYMIMEYASNGTLQALLKNEKKLSLEKTVTITQGILKGLQALHSKNIIHRDLKPANILFDADWNPKVADLGLVKVNKDNIERLTKSNEHMGTLAYMSPEQVKGNRKEVGYSSDIYAVGVMFYEMLTGKHPFIGTNNYQLIHNIVKGKISPLSYLDKNIDKYTESICMKALKTDQNKRYQQVSEFIEDLSFIANESKVSFLDHNKYYKTLLAGISGMFLGIIIPYAIYGDSNINGKSQELEKLYSKYFELDIAKNKGLSQKMEQTKIVTYKGLSKEDNQIEVNKIVRGEQLYQLALYYYDGKIIEKDIKATLQLLESAAAHDNQNAYFTLGLLYEEGKELSQNYEKAHQYYLHAAKKKHPGAFYRLGRMHEQKKVMNASYDKAEEYYMESVNNKHPDALASLLTLLQASKKTKIYKKWLKKGLEKENGYCYREIAINYFLGRYGTPKSIRKGIEYGIRAAQKGHHDTLVVMVECLEQTEVNHSIFTDIFTFYEQQVKKGNKTAFLGIGYMYHRGKGVQKNILKAKEFYELAVKELGNPTAMGNLGAIFLEGFSNIPADPRKAKKLFEKAAEGGSTRAMLNLGTMYLSGYKIKKNLSKAKELFQQAVDSGSAEALHSLGLMYYQGLGTEINYKRAFDLFSHGAFLGDRNAMLSLGNMYANGHGVTVDYAQAKENYERSANLGHPVALKNLGVMYMNGWGIAKDEKKGQEYLKKAIEAEIFHQIQYSIVLPSIK